MKLLIVTAVRQERDALLHGLDGSSHDVHAVGVGPAAAAAGTARLLAAASHRYDGVVNAGVAGGFAARAEIGDIVVALRCVSAELGVALPERFQPLGELGFGSNVINCETALTAAVTGRRADVLTLATITGHPERAASLALDFPEAAAEAMEGFGAATAAAQAGLPCAEVRAISNLVGDRDTASWDWKAGFSALTRAAKELA